jgi:hypothetical protein
MDALRIGLCKLRGEAMEGEVVPEAVLLVELGRVIRCGPFLSSYQLGHGLISQHLFG